LIKEQHLNMDLNFDRQISLGIRHFGVPTILYFFQCALYRWHPFFQKISSCLATLGAFLKCLAFKILFLQTILAFSLHWALFSLHVFALELVTNEYTMM
jgi:hypothetical protein